MAYCARVSSENQDNEEFEKLLTYCMKKRHWSVFEMAHMTVEIETTRAISAQLLRHKSFSFSEFSQRYQVAKEFDIVEARAPHPKNRQLSEDNLPSEVKGWFQDKQKDVYELCFSAYEEALGKGVAKEQARFLLPLATKSRLYMTGNVRSWIHYFNVRLEKGTQKEHKELAEEVFSLFAKEYPVCAKIFLSLKGE
jgi:thymidylate synthase (FAD)